MKTPGSNHFRHVIEVWDQARCLLKRAILKSELPLVVASARMHPSHRVKEQSVLATSRYLHNRGHFLLDIIEQDFYWRELIIRRSNDT